jgi:uncharacterized delta-60 repeat protein
MWFSFNRKNRRKQATRSRSNSFRPQLDALEDRCLMSAGALDPTFGSGGKATLANFTDLAMVVQPDNKIVAGGYVTIPGTNNVGFALARLTANGSPDASFGSNGIVKTLVGAQNSYITGLALQSNGDIVAVGMATITTATKAKGKTVTNDTFAVARYTSTGSLDSTFGSNGIVTTAVCVAPSLLDPGDTGLPGAKAVAIQTDGKIVVAGGVNTGTIPNFTGDNEFAIARYNVNGTLDTTFGSGGIVLTPSFGNHQDEATSLTLQANGDILVAGATYNLSAQNVYTPIAMAVARYLPTGQLDSSFGSGGIVTGVAPAGTTALANGVIVLGTGEIVMGGWSTSGTSYVATLACLTSTGQVKSNFGNSGFAISSINAKAFGIAQGPNGDLMAPCLAYDAMNDLAVVAFQPSGAVDTTFGINGASTVNFSNNTSRGRNIALQSDGKIVVAGSTVPSGTTLALARFLPPDTKIGSFTATPNPVTAGSSVTLSASGILNANPSSTITQVAFYLDDGDGTLEPGFDTLLGYGTNVNGVWSFSFIPTTSGTFTLFALATDSNGVASDPVTLTLQVN